MALKSDGSRKILDFAFFNALYPRVNPGFVRFLMLFTPVENKKTTNTQKLLRQQYRIQGKKR